MNKVVKAILAIMVAIIYISLVYVATTTLIPMPKNIHPPTGSSASSYSLQPNCVRTSTNSYCEDQWREYDRARLDNAESSSRYQKELDSYISTSQKIYLHRAELAILLGLVGLALLYFVRSISPLVVGFVSSSVAIIAAGVLMLEANSASPQNITISALSIFSFLALSVVIYLVDKVMFPKTALPVAASAHEFAPAHHTPDYPDAHSASKQVDIAKPIESTDKDNGAPSSSAHSTKQASQKHSDSTIHGIEARHEGSKLQSDDDFDDGSTESSTD